MNTQLKDTQDGNLIYQIVPTWEEIEDLNKWAKRTFPGKETKIDFGTITIHDPELATSVENHNKLFYPTTEEKDILT